MLSHVVTVDIDGDTLDEFDETLSVVLLNAANAFTVDVSGTGTILDDDPPPSISIGNATVVEGDSGTVQADFTVSLSAPERQGCDGCLRDGRRHRHGTDRLHAGRGLRGLLAR